MSREDEERKAALERGREAFRRRDAVPEEERTEFPRPERFSDFAIGFDAKGNKLPPRDAARVVTMVSEAQSRELDRNDVGGP